MATIKFYLEKPYLKGKLKSSEVSIFAMFTKTKEQRFRQTLDEKIQPKYWDFNNQSVRGTHPRHYEINLYLQQFKTDLLNLYGKHRHLPFEKFKALAISDKTSSEKKTLFLAYDKFLEAYQVEKDSKTVQKFQTLKRQLETFDKEYPIDFKTLDFNFYDRFKAFLYRIPNPFYKNYRLLPAGDDSTNFLLTLGNHGAPVGIFDDNVFSYITQLKTFLGWSQKRGYEINPSFKTWEVIRRVHDPITLTAKELEQLENHVFTSRALETARDYLVFECRTGQRISDIKRFDLKDLHNDKWTFSPRKGNRLNQKQVTVHFKGYCAPALSILQKYNWKMPVISEQKLNDNIKRACKAAGIDSPTTIYRWMANKRVWISGAKHEFISSHIGRKSFITLALQSGVPVEYVMQLTGITEYKTIRHYKGKFDDSDIQKYLEGIGSQAVMKKAQ